MATYWDRLIDVYCWHVGLSILWFCPFSTWLGLSSLPPLHSSVFIKTTYLLPAHRLFALWRAGSLAGAVCFKCSVRIGLNFKRGGVLPRSWPCTKSPVISFFTSVESCWFSLLQCCSCKNGALYALYITAGYVYTLPSLFSPEWEGRENGSIHNALIWKSRLISPSKGSHLPTENIIQLNAGKSSSHFKLQHGQT